MPTSKQAKKRMRQNEERRVNNKEVRSRMRTAIKQVSNAESADTARTRLAEAMKRIDKAAKQGVIHKNTAARRKSRLARAISKKK